MDRFEKIDQKFYGFSVRERLLVVLTGLFLIGMLGFVLFVEPLLKQKDALTAQVQQKERQLASVQARLNALETELNADINAPFKQELSQLTEKKQALDNQFERYTRDLVAPETMPLLLENILSQSDAVTLVSLKSIEPTKLITATPKESNEMAEISSGDAVAKAGQSMNLYRHGVALTIEGRYFDIQQFLHNVEQLGWRFYWKKFHYNVSDYPTAKVELELYTLSTSKAFLGVKNEA